VVAPKVLDEEHWKLTAGALSALGASVLLTCSLANVGAQLGQSAGSHKFGRKIIIRVVASPLTFHSGPDAPKSHQQQIPAAPCRSTIVKQQTRPRE